MIIATAIIVIISILIVIFSGDFIDSKDQSQTPLPQMADISKSSTPTPSPTSTPSLTPTPTDTSAGEPTVSKLQLSLQRQKERDCSLMIYGRTDKTGRLKGTCKSIKSGQYTCSLSVDVNGHRCKWQDGWCSRTPSTCPLCVYKSWNDTVDGTCGSILDEEKCNSTTNKYGDMCIFSSKCKKNKWTQPCSKDEIDEANLKREEYKKVAFHDPLFYEKFVIDHYSTVDLY